MKIYNLFLLTTFWILSSQGFTWGQSVLGTYSSSGNYTFVVSAGVTQVSLKAWGAGDKAENSIEGGDGGSSYVKSGTGIIHIVRAPY
jgi:hypothetical protein